MASIQRGGLIESEDCFIIGSEVGSILYSKVASIQRGGLIESEDCSIIGSEVGSILWVLKWPQFREIALL